MVNRLKINIYVKSDAAASPPVKKADYYIINLFAQVPEDTNLSLQSPKQ